MDALIAGAHPLRSGILIALSGLAVHHAPPSAARETVPVDGSPQPADVLPAPALSPPARVPALAAVDVVGSTANAPSGTALAKGNVYRVDTTVTLDELEVWLDFSDTQTLNFYVYDGPIELGTYTQVFTTSLTVTGAGPGWYGSGPLGVTLDAGLHYLLAVSWSGSMTYFYDTGDSEPTSFGAHVHAYATGDHPLGPIVESTSDDRAIYHQRLTTDGAAAPSLLHRGVVADLAPGWQSGHLPLGPANDDETPPFPVAAASPGTETDGDPPVAPLLLYRHLGPAGEPLGTVLKLAKTGPDVTLAF